MNAHTRLFAIVFVGIVFGLAFLSMFSFMAVPTSEAKNPMTYNDCLKAKGSNVLEMYPPTCITKDGIRYEKNLPKVRMVDRTYAPIEE